ncbi:MAG: hypothetical protein J5927_07590 [Oscillospiraceae bacterium]|nr:hypothetical protein [Oscillospiraceae bacterium]
MDTKKDLCSLVGEEIAAKFCRIAEENGTDAATVLSTFIMDYVVSGGHPETVGEKSQQEDTSTWLDRRWAEQEKHREAIQELIAKESPDVRNWTAPYILED